MEALAGFNTALVAFGRLLLRNRERGVAAVASSDLPEDVKRAVVEEFDGKSSDEDAIQRLKEADIEIVRAAGGILEWLRQSNVDRQQRRDASSP